MINSEFQPGFFGSLGSGGGQHASSRNDRIDYALINRIENAIEKVWSLVEGQGHYGPFKLETTDGYLTETFDGDGSTTEFTLNVAIPKEAISGYSLHYDNPYTNGIAPSTNIGCLTDFDSDTNLSNTITFDNAPSEGTDNIIVKYKDITAWGSSLNSSAYLLINEPS